MFFSVLLGIIADDFTLGYFNLTSGLSSSMLSDTTKLEVPLDQTISAINHELIYENNNNEIINNERSIDDTNATWD